VNGILTIEGEIPEVKVGGIETMRQCAEVMREGLRLTFLNRGYLQQWANLADGRPATLFRTGRLQNSMDQFISDDFAEVGTDVFYASYLHFGTRKMVARPFMLWREDMKEGVLKIMGDSVKFVDAKKPTEINIVRGSE
jgi:phage gpG-like protein